MHLKRYSMPKFWPLGKKGNKFVITPAPGPHPKHSSMPLRIVLRDVLNLADNADEAKKIITGGGVMIDGKPAKSGHRPVGLMDVISFPSSKKFYRAVPGPKGIEIEEISAKEAGTKLCSIKGKTVINGGKMQISLHDGRTIIVGKDNKYKPGDSVLIELPGQKIAAHYPLKEGVHATIVAGKNPGISGKIKTVYNRKKMQEKSRIVIDTGKGEIETLKDYVLVGESK